jgi:hypothetical protein
LGQNCPSFGFLWTTPLCASAGVETKIKLLEIRAAKIFFIDPSIDFALHYVTYLANIFICPVYND